MGPENAKAENKATMSVDQRAPMMRSYTYNDLARDHNEIRLLKLLPDSPSSPASKLLSLESGQPSILRCQLITVDLDQAPPYVALSYTWATEDGDAGLTQRIIVHSKVETNNDDLMYPTDIDEVMYITANCEDALWRTQDSSSTEFLWVDAVCINQERISERNYQVGMMDRIYMKATSVEVCINSHADFMPLMDLFETEDLMFKKKLNSFDSWPGMQELDKFFRLRYFSRVWVRLCKP